MEKKEKKGTTRDRLIILGLIAIIIFMFFKYNKKGVLDSPDTATIILLDSLRTTVDDLGRQKTELKQVYLNEQGVAQGFKKALELAKGEKLATIERMWKIHQKALEEVKDLKGEVKELTSAIANVSDRDTLILRDTIIAYQYKQVEAWAFDKSDQWLTFRGVVIPEEKQIQYEIDFDASFSHTVFDLADGGRQVNLMFDNPYMRSEGVFSVKLEPKEEAKQWAMGLFLGSTIDGKLQYGPQIEWRSMRLDIPITKGGDFRISKRLFSF